MITDELDRHEAPTIDDVIEERLARLEATVGRLVVAVETTTQTFVEVVRVLRADHEKMDDIAAVLRVLAARIVPSATELTDGPCAPPKVH